MTKNNTHHLNDYDFIALIKSISDKKIYQRLMIILETAVGRKKAVQDIDVIGGFKKRVVTLLMMNAFSNFPGVSRACADFCDPTAVSRVM